MRFLGWLLVVAVTAAAAITLIPGLLGQSMRVGLAQMIGLRPWLVAGFAVCALLMLFAAALVLAARRRRPARLITLALVFALVGAGHAGILAMRGPVAGELAAAGEGEITIMSANVWKSQADAAALAQEALDAGADVLVLPEAGLDYAADVSGRLAEAGLRMQTFPARDQTARGTAVLVSEDLGTYEEVATDALGQVLVEPADGEGPVIAGVHPVAPPTALTGAAAEERQQRWADELQQAAGLTDTLEGAIIAGDFNASLDHEPMRHLGRYVDAGVQAGVGGYGTWPARLPALLGSVIDHVLVDPRSYEVSDGAVVPVTGSDHRALLVRVSPR